MLVPSCLTLTILKLICMPPNPISLRMSEWQKIARRPCPLHGISLLLASRSFGVTEQAEESILKSYHFLV